MQIFETIDSCRCWREEQRPRKVAFVPTMGALHEGHLSLMRKAKECGELVVVSIFVNPEQFAPHEDFDQYPRTFEADRQACEDVGVDAIFLPTREMMYPEIYCTYVEVDELGKVLEGVTRPHFFRGVATVVLKLFNIVQPDCAVFGWKDAQQFTILRRMVEDLNLPIEMIGGEIVREEDGLAMSSRNRFLSPGKRKEASALSQSLNLARDLIEHGQYVCAEIIYEMQLLIKNHSNARIDYIAIVSLTKLEPLEKIQQGNTLIALAAWVDETRLIDNVRL